MDPSDVRRQWTTDAVFAGKLEPPLKGAFICRSARRVDNRRMDAPRPCVDASGKTGAGAALRAALAPLLVTMWLGVVPLADVRASDDGDHERARAAVKAGEVLPLATLLQRLQRTHPGQVLELELERDDGRWVYEVTLLQSRGQLLKLEVDAGTGKVLQLKRRQLRGGHPQGEPAGGAPR